jgi:hypothetical protein
MIADEILIGKEGINYPSPFFNLRFSSRPPAHRGILSRPLGFAACPVIFPPSRPTGETFWVGGYWEREPLKKGIKGVRLKNN